MDTNDLRGQLTLRRERAAMIVATAGTTMAEAVDDVGKIVNVCNELALVRRRIHDAALSDIPLALLPDGPRPLFDFRAGATRMAVSGHKFLSTLMPCGGALIYSRQPHICAHLLHRHRRHHYRRQRSGHTP